MRTFDPDRINLDLNMHYNAHFIRQVEIIRRRLAVPFRLFVHLLQNAGAQISTTTLHDALVSGVPLREWPSLLAALAHLSRQFGTLEDIPAYWLHPAIVEQVYTRNLLQSSPETANLRAHCYLNALMSRGGHTNWTLSLEIERRCFGAISPRTIYRWQKGEPIARGITVLPILAQIFHAPITPLIPRDFERSFATSGFKSQTDATTNEGTHEPEPRR